MSEAREIKPIWLPAIVAALVVPTVAAVLVGGVSLGIFVAVVLLAAIVFLAMRGRPRGPIEVAARPDAAHRVLLALTAPVGDTATARGVVDAARARERPTEILALAPTRPHFLDRWASDERKAEAEARHKLDLTVASLRREHLDPRAEIGDADIVGAIEDSLREFPADEVVLATGSAGEDPDGIRAAAELGRRLRIEFEHVVTPGGDGGSGCPAADNQ